MDDFINKLKKDTENGGIPNPSRVPGLADGFREICAAHLFFQCLVCAMMLVSLCCPFLIVSLMYLKTL
jgi:hypothetical protein